MLQLLEAHIYDMGYGVNGGYGCIQFSLCVQNLQ